MSSLPGGSLCFESRLSSLFLPKSLECCALVPLWARLACFWSSECLTLCSSINSPWVSVSSCYSCTLSLWSRSMVSALILFFSWYCCTWVCSSFNSFTALLTAKSFWWSLRFLNSTTSSRSCEIVVWSLSRYLIKWLFEARSESQSRISYSICDFFWSNLFSSCLLISCTFDSCCWRCTQIWLSFWSNDRLRSLITLSLSEFDSLRSWQTCYKWFNWLLKCATSSICLSMILSLSSTSSLGMYKYFLKVRAVMWSEQAVGHLWEDGCGNALLGFHFCAKDSSRQLSSSSSEYAEGLRPFLLLRGDVDRATSFCVRGCGLTETWG